MGFISQLAKGQNKTSFPGQNAGVIKWREVFGTTHKEKPQGYGEKIVPGGSYANSITSADASFIRLLNAMRSMAPGGWSDDRYEESKQFMGIVYVAIHRICQQLQQAEFQVYHKDPTHPEGKRPVQPGEPSYGLVTLLEKPNKQDSFGKLMYRWGQQKRLTGMALTWMVPNALGTPMELYSIPTCIAIPQPAINPTYPDGYYRIQPIYPYGPFSSYPTPTTAVGAPIPAQWMLRFMYPHPILRYDGFSPLTGLRLHIDEATQIDRSRWYKMKRSINPSAVLNSKDMEGSQPWDTATIDRIKAEMENNQEGPENHGNLYVPPPGSTLEEFGSRPVDMEYQQGWEQLVSFILGGGFGITKQAAGMIEDSSYATLFATMKQLHVITLEPDCDDIANDLTRHLAPFFGDDLIIEIRCKRIDDHEIVFTKIDKGIQAKCLRKNDVLRMLELPMTSEEWGNDIAGDPSPGEKEQMEQEQQMAMGGPAGPEGMPPEGMETDEEAIAADQPTPGPLGKGSLGPRKSYNRTKYKRLEELKAIRQKRILQRAKVSVNGNGRH